MRKAFLWTLGAIMFSVIVFSLYNYAVNSKYRISSEKAKELIKSNTIDVILDVRTDFERNTLGFYPGSVHIESKDLEEKMKNTFPNKKTHVLIYCNTGHRARLATEKLVNLGYSNVHYISSSYKTLM